MICPKCKKIMKCEGVSTHYQDWHCPICGYGENIKKDNKNEKDRTKIQSRR